MIVKTHTTIAIIKSVSVYNKRYEQPYFFFEPFFIVVVVLRSKMLWLWPGLAWELLQNEIDWDNCLCPTLKLSNIKGLTDNYSSREFTNEITSEELHFYF